MRKRTGNQAILEQFLADGMNFMFGNPGTVEQGFLDAVADYPEMRYILTLQESVAVMAADGYARATQRPTLVQMHSSPGLGNAIGALYQAKRGHSPLVVIGGDAGLRYMNTESQMYGDLVAFAEPVTKWSTMVLEPANLLRVIRRAIKIAATPPMGPVYVCVPADVLDAPAVEPVMPTSLFSTRVAPAGEMIAAMAQMLVAAATPIIFVGDGVAYSGAQAELTRVAELLGAEVWEADSGEVNMAYDHPLYQGMTGHMFGFASKPITQKGDVNLVCGTYMLPEVFPELGPIFAEGAKVIHIDLDPGAIAKNHPVDLGVLADPKLTLGLLAEAIDASFSSEQRAAAQARAAAIGQRNAEKRASLLEADQAVRDSTPLKMSRFMEELVAQLPSEDVIIVDEALTSSPALVRYWPPQRTGAYFLTRGGSLGIGFPGAIGAKLANPTKTVLGFSGDGGSMYTIQSLWSAARHNLDVKFIVCNNSSYRLLQLNIDQYWKDQGLPKRDYPLSFDLSSPPLGFVDIARGMGVAGVRVEQPEEVAGAIKQMLEHPGPFLIDLALEGDVHPERVGATCGQ
ncbi:thiamine pyrophosphate-binding protein [Candidatus Chloroploca sp. Khr17]|uniref:thiamine pyrophosphate-binding protein n=1 Tax=Candidatus Chloroploca sp. Khr17 TaxID=2496869 RepID=UPI00101D554E|nr:thiamine pyrophosphate-binding protein [Candidatus Chloroploca sp. Khr17]